MQHLAPKGAGERQKTALAAHYGDSVTSLLILDKFIENPLINKKPRAVRVPVVWKQKTTSTSRARGLVSFENP